MFLTPADVDAKIRVYLRDERILTCGSVGVARCRLPHKKVDFSLKMISEITAEPQLPQVPLCTLFSSVILHHYVELLQKNRTLKRILQALKSLLKFKCPILAT